MMNNALINIYQEAIAKNSVIQAQLPNRLSIKAVNELVQAIEAIFLPQYPNAIAHRSLFHKLVQYENEEAELQKSKASTRNQTQKQSFRKVCSASGR